MVSCSRWSICHGVILLFGLFAGVVALLTFFYVPSVIRKQIEEVKIKNLKKYFLFRRPFWALMKKGTSQRLLNHGKILDIT